MLISLIVTTKNEADSLPRLLDSIAVQTRLPDEIVIVDGGSTDGTLDLLHSYGKRLPLTLISLPGANISQGRNAAIRAARGEIIASTDAGVRLDPCWLTEITRPLGRRLSADQGLQQTLDRNSFSAGGRQPAAVDVVSGFFLPDPHGSFETALAATTLPALTDVRPDKFLPSSRSLAFRRAAWEKVDGYPEWLDYCEDLIFDFALRNAGFRFQFAPLAVVYFRPRENLRAFFLQYYRYARGDGKANLWLKRHILRYATYLAALPLTILLVFVAPPLGLGILGFGFLALFFTPYKRLLPRLGALAPLGRLGALVWVPVIRVTGDIAKMIGYPVGVVWRASRRVVDMRVGPT